MQFKVNAKEYAEIREHIKKGQGWVMQRRATPLALRQLEDLPITVVIITTKSEHRLYAQLYDYRPSNVEGRGPRLECYLRGDTYGGECVEEW